MSNLSLSPSLLKKYRALTRDCIAHLNEQNNTDFNNDTKSDKAATYNTFIVNMTERNGAMVIMNEMAQILNDHKKISKELENIKTQKTQSADSLKITGSNPIIVYHCDYVANREPDKSTDKTESQENERLQKEDIKLKKINKKLTEEMNDLKETNKELNKEMNDLKKTNKELNKEMNDLKEINKELNKEMNDLKETNKELNKEMNDLKEINKDLENEIKRLKEPTIGFNSSVETF